MHENVFRHVASNYELVLYIIFKLFWLLALMFVVAPRARRHPVDNNSEVLIGPGDK